MGKSNNESTKIFVSKNFSPEAYKSTPWWYDLRGFFILTFSYRDTLWSQIDFFNKNIGRIHLEGAIGTGTLSYYILKFRKLFNFSNDFKFYGVDYAPEMLNGAKEKLRGNNIEIEMGDLTKLRFKENYFDSVNIANSFHTIKDIHLALTEIHRVIKEDGSLAMNILLYPLTNKRLDYISNKINTWGQKKEFFLDPTMNMKLMKWQRI
jgi:ubiquinone/menaquinone biosynthesis C-methylase UbiE